MKTNRATMVGPANSWELVRKFQINFLKMQGLKPSHTYLDIGCGVLRGGIPIIRYLEEGKYFGIEASDKRLAEGKAEVREAGLMDKKPTLIVSDMYTCLDIPQQFDIVLAYSVFIHMTDAHVEDCLKFLGTHLTDMGSLYANVPTGGRRQGRWQEFPAITRPLTWYEDACKRNGLTHLKVIGNMGDLVSRATNDEFVLKKRADHKLMLRIQK